MPTFGSVTIEDTFKGKPDKQVLAINAFSFLGVMVTDVPQLQANGTPDLSRPSLIDVEALKRGVRDICYAGRGMDADYVSGQVAVANLDQITARYAPQIAELRNARKAHDLSFDMSVAGFVAPDERSNGRPLIANNTSIQNLQPSP